MASPFSPYDPIYLSHWAFMDYIWHEWQESNPMGESDRNLCDTFGVSDL